MILTRRSIMLIVFAALLVALSGLFSVLFWLGLALNLTLLSAIIIDWINTPSPSRISAARHCEEKLSIGARNVIRITFQNRSGVPLNIEAKDEPPPLFDVTNKLLRVDLPANSDASASYAAIPKKRGNHEFGDINIRYPSRLKLFKRQSKIAQNMQVKVYPNLLELKKYVILARSGRFSESGLRYSKRYGEGTEFESLRDYLPDDDYRRINWKASARFGRPISNEYEHERNQNVTIMLDCGRMMTADIDNMSRLDYMINAALMLGYVCYAKGDNIGLVAFSDEIEAYIPPRRGKSQLHQIIEALYDVPPRMRQPDYERAFTLVESRLRKRSMIVVFTDLIDVEIADTLISYLPILRPHHLVLCISLRDSDLVDMADAMPDNVGEVYQKAVAGQLLMEQQNIVNKLRESGVLILNVPPEKLSTATVNKYLELKGRNLI